MILKICAAKPAPTLPAARPHNALDPQYMVAYTFGAIIFRLSMKTPRSRLTEKGIAATPGNGGCPASGYIHGQARAIMKKRRRSMTKAPDRESAGVYEN